MFRFCSSSGACDPRNRRCGDPQRGSGGSPISVWAARKPSQRCRPTLHLEGCWWRLVCAQKYRGAWAFLSRKGLLEISLACDPDTCHPGTCRPLDVGERLGILMVRVRADIVGPVQEHWDSHLDSHLDSHSDNHSGSHWGSRWGSHPDSRLVARLRGDNLTVGSERGHVGNHLVLPDRGGNLTVGLGVVD